MTASVLVTGGSSGIGAAIARALATVGYEVTITFNRTTNASEIVCSGLDPEVAARISAIACDFADEGAVAQLASTLADRPEPLHGIVHAAGTAYDAPAFAIDLSRAKDTMQVNFWSLVTLVGQLMRPMMRAREGHVIIIGSIAARVGGRGNSVYAATKAALEGYARCLADEAGRRHVNVNVIAPGFVDTRMIEHLKGHLGKSLGERVPEGRLAQPEEIAALAVFLLSGDARYINGATIPVDGGLSATSGISGAS